MAMSSNQDMSFQQWSTIQHNLSLSSDYGNFEPDHLDWLQGAEELLANFPDGIQDSESFTHLDPALNDMSALASVRRGNSGASPSILTVEIPSGQVEPAKRSRGRPKVKGIRSLTSPDRRKNQVRLAQQAYRNRKEVATVTLREECERLNDTLVSMSDLFDGFFEYASKSRVAKGEVEFEQRLSQTAAKMENLYKGHRYQSKSARERIEDERGRIGSEGQAEQRSSLKSSSADTSSKSASDASNSSSEQNRESLTSNEDTSGSWPLKSLFNLEASPAFPQISLSFSSRLRHAGLQRSYRLVASRNTPIQSLCQVFRYCIFHSSRDHIVQRVKFLLHESVKYTISTQNGGAGIIPINRITHEDELSWTPHPVAEMNVMREESQREHPDHAAFMTTNLFGYKEDLQDREGKLLTADLQNGRSDFVHADNVEEYLSLKGLHISPGAGVVELRRDLSRGLDTYPTLFDELRATQLQDVKVSVDRLFCELLDRAVCLPTGPAFRKLDIDDAISGTLSSGV